MKVSLALCCFAFVAIASCGGKADPDSTATPAVSAKSISAADRTEAKKHFGMLCVSCHGQSGKGDGPAGKALKPAPRDWTDKTWQASVDDKTLAKTILEGGAAVGLSPLMPPNAMYKGRPGVIDALVEIVRGYAK